MPPPEHVSIIRHVLHVGIADVSLTRPDPVGAVLPASDLIVVSTNIVTWSAAHPLLCYSVGCLQSLVSTLHRPSPSVSSCFGTLHDLPLVTLSLIVVFHFLRRFVPCVLHWHKIAVNVLLCSRDLEVLLSHLCTARSSCAFPR